MKISVERIFKGPEYTIGKMYLDGAYFCDTLEDPVRDLGPDGKGKVYGNTAIPEGSYEVILSMSNRFGRVLPEVLRVPFFSGIRIHSGNTAADTSGCLLVGLNRVVGKVIDSRIWEAKLLKRLHDVEGLITLTIS